MSRVWFLSSLLAYCANCLAQPVLEKVLDGDTVIIREEAHSYHLRLLDIDAPELHQDFGKQSKRSLVQFCLNTNIYVKTNNNLSEKFR